MLKYFVLAFILFASPAIAQDYQYLQLVLQWPSITCQMSGCVSHRNRTAFTLHGMWPGNYTAQVTCNAPTQAAKFNKNLLARDYHLENDMNTAWPDVLQRSSNASWGFWDAQYNKHGTCAKFASQNQYLRKAVDLWKANNVTDMLSKHQITSQRRSYTLNNTVSAIENEISDAQAGNYLKPILRCFNYKGYDWLWEVAFCYDSTGANRINCTLVTHFKSHSCGPNIHF